MFDLKKTTEQLIYEHTAKDEFMAFNKRINKGFSKNEKPNAFPDFPMNRLVYSLTYNKKIQDLSKEYHGQDGGLILGYVVEDPDERGYYHGPDYIGIENYIDLVKIGDHNFTFKQSMEIIKSVREDLGPEVFYGAVIINNKHVDVNPLHPLVLNEFMKLTDGELVEHNLTNYSVVIYTFKDEISDLKEKYPTKFEIQDRFASDILDLISGTSFIQERFTRTEDVKLDIINSKYQIEYKEVIVDQNEDEVFTEETDQYKQSYVIPGQILNLNGLTYPYYGAIYVKGGKAWNLSPMLATNINNPQELGGDGWKIGSNICTKVGDARTADGCKTLNHSNTTSQRNPKTFRDGSMGYAQVAVDVSLSTYFDDYNPNKSKVVLKKKLTFQEFVLEDATRTKKDYIAYLKKRLENKKQIKKEEK